MDTIQKFKVENMTCAICQKPAKLQCPRCLELDLEKDLSAFCSQDCFKSSWKDHKKIHIPTVIYGWHYCTQKGKGRSIYRPDFNWTGSLRPSRIGPMRTIPENIIKPDYYFTGYPSIEQQSSQQIIPKIFTDNELEGIRKASRIGRDVLDMAHKVIRPGITTDEIDKVVHEATIIAGAYPAPYNYFDFPRSVCTSVNEVICHGIPDRRNLMNGDIINVDVTIYYKGYYGDLNETFVVGECDDVSKKLIKVAHDCLHKAIEICKPGAPYREIGNIINKHAKQHSMTVVRSYGGHGVGELFHCAPKIPHYENSKAKGVMKIGEVFTIEPMINLEIHRDKTWPDGWTSVTEDGKKSAQFEHTIVITPTGYEILTGRLSTSPPLWWEVDIRSR